MPAKKQTAQKPAPKNSHTEAAAQAWLPFYTIERAADLLGLSEGTLRKYASQKRLKAYKQSGRLYFLHSDLIEFITGGK